jgi:ribosomal protein L23
MALEPAPDCIVVEASGVSDPRRIAQIARADPGLIPDATIVLVAADQWRTLSRDRYVGDTVKQQVAAAVATQYGVKVDTVRIVIAKGKVKRTVRNGKPYEGQRKDIKKAYVTLVEGDSIKIFDEVEAEEKK